jgi:hypothetical protein
MRQTLHIVGKDMRQLWGEIALVWVSTVLFAVIGLLRATPHKLDLQLAWPLSMALLLIAWWLLITRLVHAETLVGTRPFWMTRPYSWRSLLAAKALFIIAFINIPWFVAQVAIVRRYGFPFAGALPGLMLKQAMIAVAFLLPSAVLAALTTGLVQVLLALVGVGVGYIVLWIMWTNMGIFPGLSLFAFDWLRGLLCAVLAALAGVVILLLQYRKRSTVLSVSLALASLVGVAWLQVRPPWPWILDLQSKLSREHVPSAEVTVRLNSQRALTASVRPGKEQVFLHLIVPVEIASSSGLSGRVDSVDLALQAGDGTALSQPAGLLSENSIVLQTMVPAGFYRKIKDEPLKLQGRAYVTLFRPVATIVAPDGKPAAVPGGRCTAESFSDGPAYSLLCTSALRSDRELRTVRMQVAVDGSTEYVLPNDQYYGVSYSLLPADFDLDPVSRRQYLAVYRTPVWRLPQAPVLMAVEVKTSVPIAHLWTNVEIAGPRLSDHEEGPQH